MIDVLIEIILIVTGVLTAVALLPSLAPTSVLDWGFRRGADGRSSVALARHWETERRAASDWGGSVFKCLTRRNRPLPKPFKGAILASKPRASGELVYGQSA